MRDLHFIYNVKSKEEIAKHILLMNRTFNFNQVYSDINTRNCSATIITRSQKMSLAFDHFTSPGGHAGITDVMLSYIYPDYKRSKFFGDEHVYFDNLDNNIFVLTMKSFLIIFVPSKINQFQYDCITRYINELKKNEYVKQGKINSVFINDDEFPFDEIDENIVKLKDNITTLSIPNQYPFSQISNNEESINEFINKYYQSDYKVR